MGIVGGGKRKGKCHKGMILIVLGHDLRCFNYLSISHVVSCLLASVFGEQCLILLLGLDERFFEEVGV